MEVLTLLVSGEKHTRKLLRDMRRNAARRSLCLEIFIAALLITPGAWLFWTAMNTPPMT